MIRYFAAHPTAANILMFIILLLGLAAQCQRSRGGYLQSARRQHGWYQLSQGAQL